MDPRFAEVSEALAAYFDGIYEGDTDKLGAVFHPDAHLYSSTEGALAQMTLAEYLGLVAGRPSPQSQDMKRFDRILSIDFSGPTTALAKVELGVPPKYFTDYLTLLKLDGRWRIISKTYHFVVHE
ncbi:MAG: nuclear transport factor 2 family protein [Alphaproteobacteria bacterium]|nr:nuclear transport factor 2 family protein [Alphaproteobacteria bacterium]